MKSKVNDRLAGISAEDLEVAQQRLNTLCDEYKMKHILLNHGKGDWRELCYRMIGIALMERKPSGRPAKDMDKEQQDYFFAYMDIVDEFPFIDDGKETIQKTSVDKKIEMYSETYKPADHETIYTSKKHKGINKLTNLWNNFGRKRLKELEIQELKRREKHKLYKPEK